MNNILRLIIKIDFSGFGDAARIYGGTDHHPKFYKTLKSQLLQVRIQNKFCFYGRLGYYYYTKVVVTHLFCYHIGCKNKTRYLTHGTKQTFPCHSLT